MFVVPVLQYCLYICSVTFHQISASSDIHPGGHPQKTLSSPLEFNQTYNKNIWYCMFVFKYSEVPLKVGPFTGFTRRHGTWLL